MATRPSGSIQTQSQSPGGGQGLTNAAGMVFTPLHCNVYFSHWRLARGLLPGVRNPDHAKPTLRTDPLTDREGFTRFVILFLMYSVNILCAPSSTLDFVHHLDG